jgi:hypothetical protein
MPARLFQRVASGVMGLPGPGALRDDPARLAAVTPRSEEREVGG